MFTHDAAALCCTFIANDQLMSGDAGGHVNFLRLERADKYELNGCDLAYATAAKEGGTSELLR